MFRRVPATACAAWLRHTGAIAFVACLTGAPAAYSQEAHIRFSVPAQPLASGLLQLGQQARISIAAPQDLVSGKRSEPLEGDMSVRDALTRILGSSGLRFEFVNAEAARILPPAKPGPDAAASAVMLEEVVVTATKRPESQRDVPIAITALGQRAIERLGPSSAQDAMRFVPGVNFSSNGGNSVNYTIRGVNTGTATGNVQSTVAVYVDDLSILDPYYPKITTNLRLFDVDHIEVLRGPQGTLFGSGALGGAIRLITNKPNSRELESAAEMTLSSVEDGDEGYAVNGMLNMPLSQDRLAMRVVGYYQRDPGYVDNTRTGEEDVNSMISRGGRVQLLYTPTDRLKLMGSVLVQNDDPNDSAYTFYAGNSYTFANYMPNRFPQQLTIYSLTGEYDASFATLTNITSYADKDEYSRIDFTARSMAITGLDGLSTISDYGPSKTFSEEARLASRGDGAFQWLVGGMYSKNRRTIFEQVYTVDAATKYGTDYLVDSDFHRVTEEVALFGELTYHATERLALTAGLRAFENQIDVVERSGGPLNTARTLSSSIDQDAVTPKVAATFTVSPEATVYAQAAKGFRIGQNNVVALQTDPISGETIPASYDPDSLWNYEIGTKTGFFGNRLAVNAAVYYIDWKDIQLSSRTSGNGLSYISNAGDATIKGAELEVRAAPTESFDLGTSLSFIDSELTSLRNGATGTIGQRLPASAKFTTSNYLQYSMPIASGRGFARVDHRFIGKQIDRLGASALTYGDFHSFNVRTGVDFGTYEVAAFVNNVANGDHIESALAVQGQSVALRQQPRTVGLTVRVRY